MQKSSVHTRSPQQDVSVTVSPADVESLRAENQRLLECQRDVQRNLADLSGELLNLARVLEQGLAFLQIASVQCSPQSTPANRTLAQALSHSQSGITYLHRTQQDLTRLRVSLTPAPGPPHKREHLSALLNVSQALNSTLDLNQLLDLTLDIVIEATGAQRGFLMLYENEPSAPRPVLRIQVARNVDRQSIAGPAFEISRSIIEHVGATGEPILTTNAQADPRFAEQASVIGYGLRAILCVALSVKERITGVIYVDSRARAGLFSTRDLDFLVGFANQSAMAIENARLYQAVSSGYLDTIKALAAAIDARDPRTFGHSDRVTCYTLRMAQALHLPEREHETLRYAAILHDIGKIGVDDRILRKPGPLNQEEQDIMSSHPVIGILIIDGIEFLQGTRPLIRHHHEWWNGAGYPDRLAGEDIPLGARILAIADAYDVMVSGRPYRKAISVVEATEELRAGAGTQFDPALVNIFIQEVAAKSSLKPPT